MTRIESHKITERREQPPALALVLSRAMKCLGDRHSDFATLTAVIEVDAVLTGCVLGVVRSPIYGLAASQVTLGRAVQTLGRRVMRRILDSRPLIADDAESTEFACRHWTHSVAVGAAARWLVNQDGAEDPEEAYLTGLVHDIGGLVTPRGESVRVRAVRAEAIVRGWHLGTRVAAVARWHHALGAGATLEALGVEGARVDDSTVRLLRTISRAEAFATRYGFGGEPMASTASEEDPDSGSVREAIELELDHAADVLGLDVPSPTEFANVLARHETVARRELEESGARRFGDARDALHVAALHRELVDTRGMTSINDMLDRGLREIHEKLRLDRLLLLEPDSGDESMLRLRTAIDPASLEYAGGPGGFAFPLEPGGAIARALETDIACLGNDEDLDREAMTRLGVTSFAAVPLRAGPALMGVVVADQCFTGAQVTEGDTAVLAMLCSALGLAMENAALDTATKKLRSLAEKDELTGIDNRRNILAVLQREIDRARRYGKPLAVAMVDVDHFKTWNDAHGHQVGDEILKVVAQIISSVSREIDAYGRYGGEEFLIVLPETSADQGVIYAERLRSTIASHGETLAATYPDTSLSVSVGLTSLGVRDDADRMIQRADAALYAAKKHGRNRVCVEMAPPPPPRSGSRGVNDGL
jgi:two-component system cell cycle response regulator